MLGVDPIVAVKPPDAFLFRSVTMYFLIILFLIHALNLRAASSLPPDLTECSLEELMNIPVRAASKYEQKQSEAPADVTIVTKEDVKKYGYRTLADILRSVRGFFVTNDRNYSYNGVSGFNRPGDLNTRILLLVDGHRINDNIFDTAPIGRDFPVDIDLFDRVEIIRGPGSSLYGANAFFAVINIITRRGRDFKGKGVEVTGEAGSFNTYYGRLSYGARFDRKDLEVLVSGSYFNSRGPQLFFQEFNRPETNSGITRNTDSERVPSFYGKISYKDLTLSGVYHSREKGIPTGAFGIAFNDPRNKTIDTRAYLDLKYERIFDDRWGLTARLFYDYYHYDGDFIMNDPPLKILNKDVSHGTWWGGEAQLSRKFFDRHKVILGAEYRHNLRQDQFNFNEAPFQRFLEDRRSSTIWALYIQDEITILKNLRLNAGVRHDQYSTFGGTTNPRVALIYNPFRSTNLKFLYGTAFRAPNFYEMFYQDGGVSQKPNPDLKPEKIATYEVVWEQYLSRQYRLVVAGFYYHIRNLITQRLDPQDDLIIFRNLGQVDAKGLELELHGRWAGGWEGRISYTFQDARNVQSGTPLTNSPKHLPKANLTIPLLRNKIFGGMELQYLSRRLTLGNSHVGDALIGNFTLFSRNIVKNLELSASVYNIFNQRFRDPGGEEHLLSGMFGIPQDGISFRVKLLYAF